MKKTLLFNLIAFSLFALVSVGKANAQATATDLFFSEYIEGSGQNKAIEIFNGTGATVDLSAYVVKQSHNGTGWGVDGISYLLPLTGTLNNNDVYVISADDATINAGITAVADLAIIYNNAVQGGTIPYFNGNDAMGLFKNDVLIDVIGVPSESTEWTIAGTATATKDHTLVRKSTVTGGATDWAVSAGTTADDSQWIVNAKDDISNLGKHTFGTTGLNKFSVSKTTIYPNPAKSFFNIKAAEGKYLVTVNNSIGSIVKSVNINSADKIEISDLRPGIYYVTVENMKTNRKEVQKLIVR